MASAENVINPIVLTDAEVKFYNREGYLVLPGFVRSEAVAPLREETWIFIASYKSFPESGTGLTRRWRWLV